MKKTLHVAIIQLNPGADVKKNITAAFKAIMRARKNGAALVVLPEVFLYRGNPKQYSQIHEEVGGPITSFFAAYAKSLKVNLVLGTMIETSKTQHKYYDTTICLNSNGDVCGIYRKKNLFRVAFGEKYIDETAYFLPGSHNRVCTLAGWHIGIGICFDIRFPDLFKRCRRMGSEIFCIPANFTYRTGRAHWKELLRSRAIETQSFVLAANCCGSDPYTHVRSFGHSMIVDPWGTVCAEAGNREAIIYADIAREKVQEIRKKMPLF